MLGHKRVPSREGGIEVVVEELSTRMVKQGHQVTCYNRSGHHVGGRKFDADKIHDFKGITIKTVWTVDGKGLAAISASISGAIHAAFGRYDVVHFHAEGPCAMMWLPKLLGKKCVCTIHGLDWKRAKWGRLASAYIMFGEKCAGKKADEIIVLSKDVQKYFKDRYERDAKLIPNGVNRPILRAANIIKKRYGLKKDNYILFLGRIVPEKGIGYLIDAFKKVCTDKKLVIAGGSSDTRLFEKELRKKAKTDTRILFTGFVQGEELEELYSNAYVYILPSDLEGMPLSLLEAMSYGNCCLVSDIKECTDVVEDKALSFEKSSVEDLKKKLQFIFDNKDIVQKYKAEATNFICQKYNWDDVVEKTIGLYRG